MSNYKPIENKYTKETISDGWYYSMYNSKYSLTQENTVVTKKEAVEMISFLGDLPSVKVYFSHDSEFPIMVKQNYTGFVKTITIVIDSPFDVGLIDVGTNSENDMLSSGALDFTAQNIYELHPLKNIQGSDIFIFKNGEPSQGNGYIILETI